jgi:hypothetical protein
MIQETRVGPMHLSLMDALPRLVNVQMCAEGGARLLPSKSRAHLLVEARQDIIVAMQNVDDVTTTPLDTGIEIGRRTHVGTLPIKVHPTMSNLTDNLLRVIER